MFDFFSCNQQQIEKTAEKKSCTRVADDVDLVQRDCTIRGEREAPCGGGEKDSENTKKSQCVVWLTNLAILLECAKTRISADSCYQ